MQGDDKKNMLVVQSLRNTLMATILTATITILVNLGLAALSNNAYNESHSHHHHHHHHDHGLSTKLLGSKSDLIFALKYASASLILVTSFMCSSMAIGFLIDANFLMNISINAKCGDNDDDDGGKYLMWCDEIYTHSILERGFTLALVANRLLCCTIPILMWMLGPFPVFLSSLALVWLLHHLDFIPRYTPNKY